MSQCSKVLSVNKVYRDFGLQGNERLVTVSRQPIEAHTFRTPKALTILKLGREASHGESSYTFAEVA